MKFSIARPLLTAMGLGLCMAGPLQAANVAWLSQEHSPLSLGATHTVSAVTPADIDAGGLAGFDVLVV